MNHPPTFPHRRAGLALLAALAVGAFGLGAWPGLRAATPGDGAMPGAVWIDFGTNEVALRSQLARTKGTFLGMTEVMANGTGRWAQVTQQLSIPEAPGEDGLFHATGSHVFLFADGSTFTTQDEILLAPTGTEGVFGLDGTLVVTGGTGALASASGHLSLVGNLDLLHGQIGVDTRGRIQK